MSDQMSMGEELLERYDVSLLEQRFLDLGITLTKEQKIQFLQYYEYLVEKNQVMNLRSRNMKRLWRSILRTAWQRQPCMISGKRKV